LFEKLIEILFFGFFKVETQLLQIESVAIWIKSAIDLIILYIKKLSQNVLQTLRSIIIQFLLFALFPITRLSCFIMPWLFWRTVHYGRIIS